MPSYSEYYTSALIHQKTATAALLGDFTGVFSFWWLLLLYGRYTEGKTPLFGWR